MDAPPRGGKLKRGRGVPQAVPRARASKDLLVSTTFEYSCLYTSLPIPTKEELIEVNSIGHRASPVRSFRLSADDLLWLRHGAVRGCLRTRLTRPAPASRGPRDRRGWRAPATRTWGSSRQRRGLASNSDYGTDPNYDSGHANEGSPGYMLQLHPGFIFNFGPDFGSRFFSRLSFNYRSFEH
ncbi:hypothetical protein EVAR_158_1 [Eumeta japonica]|uniref:Uncharacterized protein n=1 Tax=Eumeta variegata TaxID=151549 RepID=A0A4C1S8Q1_EUMVA|nr:hypothetical protein EVAR_158_1 [Eumeta japonica]